MSHTRSTNAAPDQETIARGAKYCCLIDRDWRGRGGRISDEQGALRWLYRVRDSPSGRGWANPFNKPDFVVERMDGQVEVVVRRALFVPPVFHIIDGDSVIGRIRMISPLRNRYAIDIDRVGSWTFKMPLFTVRCHGDSEAGTDIWVVIGPSQRKWCILIRPGVVDRHLVAALAFIHNEAWYYD
jgi:hypothetical protein